MREQYGTNDSYHNAHKEDHSKTDFSDWAPVVHLQNEGKLEEAWNLMKAQFQKPLSKILKLKIEIFFKNKQNYR